MHYPNFGEMAAHLACKFNAASIPAIAAMAEENPAVSHCYQQVPIVKMSVGQNHFRFLLHAQKLINGGNRSNSFGNKPKFSKN